MKRLKDNTLVQWTSQKTKEVYVSKIEPVVSTILQFCMWYMLFHTIYWSIEQLRFTWCVPCGFTGYMQSLVTSQSLVCRLLTTTSKTMSDHQLSTITMLSSFIGMKCLSLASPSTDQKKSESEKNAENAEK